MHYNEHGYAPTEARGGVVQGSAYGGEMFGYGRDTKISDLMEKIKDPDFQQQVSDVAGEISGALDQSKPKPPPPPPGPFALSPFFRANNVWLYLLLAGGGYGSYLLLKKD